MSTCDKKRVLTLIKAKKLQKIAVIRSAAAAQEQPFTLPSAAFQEAAHGKQPGLEGQLQLSIRGKWPEVGSASHNEQ